MNLFLVLGLVLVALAIAGLLVLGLCRGAKQGDEADGVSRIADDRNRIETAKGKTNMNRLTEKEAREWAEHLKEEKLIQFIKDHHAIKNGVCERMLGIATSSDKWVESTVIRVDELLRKESALTVTIREIEATIEAQKFRVRETRCFNCRGTGKTEPESCCICKGTGLRYF